MDLKDVSSRFKKTRMKEAEAEKPFDFGESLLIRARMVGVLLQDARLSAGRTVEDCARVLQVEPAVIEAWEFGDGAPSLPQLEILAYYLDVPISHFWGSATRERERSATAQQEYFVLRDRMVGVLLQQAREELSLSLEDVSEQTGIDLSLLQQYEFGEVSIPMHHLTVLAGAVRRNMSYFLETSSHVGELLALRESWASFAALPEDIRKFAANPLNVGFIEIALMLSQMPTERLRRVGESVLNITM